jgi:hypothetical protein
MTEYGFLQPADLATLRASAQYRLTPVLVRCGGCRFTAPAQDVQHLIDIITADGRDYVRDVSIPAGFPTMATLRAFLQAEVTR